MEHGAQAPHDLDGDNLAPSDNLLFDAYCPTTRDAFPRLLRNNPIALPKTSGYRCIHLVYRYNSDRKTTYNELQIEIQIRSRLQHAWATAVETVGTFLQHSLKSSEGPDQWLRFFAHVGSVFARIEDTPLVPGTPTSAAELFDRVSCWAESLAVISRLHTYGLALQVLGTHHEYKDFHFFLLKLRSAERTLEVEAFPRGQLEQATAQYLAVEKSIASVDGAEAVLVAAESLEALRLAYPNYFLDTTLFVKHLDAYLRGSGA